MAFRLTIPSQSTVTQSQTVGRAAPARTKVSGRRCAPLVARVAAVAATSAAGSPAPDSTPTNLQQQRLIRAGRGRGALKGRGGGGHSPAGIRRPAREGCGVRGQEQQRQLQQPRAAEVRRELGGVRHEPQPPLRPAAPLPLTRQQQHLIPQQSPVSAKA